MLSPRPLGPAHTVSPAERRSKLATLHSRVRISHSPSSHVHPRQAFYRHPALPGHPPLLLGGPMVYPVCSDEIRRYLSALEAGADECYRIASDARRKGFDPSLEVEIPKTQDLASRVEELLQDWQADGLARRTPPRSARPERGATAILGSQGIARRPAKAKAEANER